jgi:hypothetical protein
MKKQISKWSFLLVATSALLFSACEKENGGEVNEEEVITTVQLTFVPQGGGGTLTYKFEDLDGPGGNTPVVDPVILAANTTYMVTVQLLNKTVTPPEDITEEVAEEAQAHRFYYQPSAGSNITVSGLNNDGAGMPLGITSTWTTGAAATGTIRVILRHYPGNPANKATDDPVDSPKSSTDAEAEFITTVQ